MCITHYLGRGLIICAWSEYCMSYGFERFCTIASPPPPILIILWMISPTHKKCGDFEVEKKFIFTSFSALSSKMKFHDSST